MSQHYVTMGKIAERFGVSPQTIRRWVSSGYIPEDTYLHIGDTFRFNQEKVEAALLDLSRENKAATDPQPDDDMEGMQDELDFGDDDDAIDGILGRR